MTLKKNTSSVFSQRHERGHSRLHLRIVLLLVIFASGCGYIGETDQRRECKATGGDWVVERRTTPAYPQNCGGEPIQSPQVIVWRHSYCSCPSDMTYSSEEGCIPCSEVGE